MLTWGMWALHYTNIQAAETRHSTLQTLRSEARDDNNTLFLNPRDEIYLYLYHLNLKYSQVCEGSDCWLELGWDNWFTLFAWLGLVSVLIKITIRNSVLIISYCENIITGTLIWIITGLDSWDTVSVARMSVSVSCGWGIHWGQPHVSDRDEITPASVPTQWQNEGGGKKIRITIQMKLEMPSFDPHLPSTTRQMGAVIPTVLINSSHLTPDYEDSL